MAAKIVAIMLGMLRMSPMRAIMSLGRSATVLLVILGKREDMKEMEHLHIVSECKFDFRNISWQGWNKDSSYSYVSGLLLHLGLITISCLCDSFYQNESTSPGTEEPT